MFEGARLKLTGWYLIIIMIITIGFSAVIYKMVAVEIDRFAIRQQIRVGMFVFEPEWASETKKKLILNLAVIDGTIVLVAGVLGYFLAGQTLGPIGRMMEEQNRFVSDASHELKTPLTALKSAFEVHLRDKRPKIGETRELMAEALSEVNKLQRLVEALLRLARHQNNNGQATVKKRINISDTVETAIKRVGPLADNKKINILFERSESTVLGVGQNLEELWTILLDNAIKYSPEKTDILIKVIRGVKKTSVIVSDSGVGIARNELRHIFDRFYRSDKARTSGGYGLGLAIAKEIVESHGAKIEVESKVNKGTSFTVSFQN